MNPYKDFTPEQRRAEYSALTEQYNAFKNMKLKLDMTRGKPGEDQLALSMPMLDVLTSGSDCRDSSGVDCRNYGELLGTMDARILFAGYLDIAPEETIVVGSASLNFMYDCIARAMLKGVLGKIQLM